MRQKTLVLAILISILYTAIAAADPLTTPIKPDDNQKVLAIDTANSTILIATSQHVYLYNIKTNSNGVPSAILTLRSILPQIVQRRNEFLELKLLSPNHFVYCDIIECRMCTHSAKKSSCAIMELKINGTKSIGIKSASTVYSHPRVLLRIVDTWNRTAILSYYATKAINGALLVMQSSFDAPRITHQATVGAFSIGDYLYFVGSSFQKIDRMSNIDPQAYASTTNSKVVKITRVCAKDFSGHLATRMDLTLECRRNADTSVAISEVSGAHYDSKKGDLWFTVYRVNGANSMCKYSIKEIDKKFEDVWDTCQGAGKHGTQRDCKKIDPEFLGSNHCFIFARSANNKLESCSSFKEKKGEKKRKSGNCDIGSNANYGRLEYFKPMNDKKKENPVLSMNANDETVTQIFPEHQYKSIIYSTYNSKKYTHIYMSSTKPNSKVVKVLKVQSNIKTPRSIAIAKNNLCYINGTTVLIMPMLCEEYYKMCESPANKEKKITIVPVKNDPVTSTSRPVTSRAKEKKITIVPVNQDNSKSATVPVAKKKKPNTVDVNHDITADVNSAIIVIIVCVVFMCSVCIAASRSYITASTRSSNTTLSMSISPRCKESQSKKLVHGHNHHATVTVELLAPPDDESSSESEPEGMVIDMVAPPSEESSSDSSSNDSEPEGMEIEMVAPPSDDE